MDTKRAFFYWSVTKVKSKYFLLLSDDDLLMPDALENLNYILENVEDFNIMSFSKNITYHYKDYPSFLAGWTHIGKYDGKF